MRVRDIESFIKKSKTKFEDRFEYTQTTYSGKNAKITIKCKKHGNFITTSSNHLRSLSGGCEKCYLENQRKPYSVFEKNAMRAHQNKYVYDSSSYVDRRTKMRIVCPEHGEFWQTPDNHSRGRCCPKCAHKSESRIKDWQDFLTKARIIHGDKYTYPNFGAVTPSQCDRIPIICPEHGEFWDYQRNHVRGVGCYMCSNEREKEHSVEYFCSRLEKLYNGNYEIKKADYDGATKTITVHCKTHDVFFQAVPHRILQWVGCSRCVSHFSEIDAERVKRLFTEIHADRYDYSKVEYTGWDEKVCIICPEHGEFWQALYSHKAGSGCPKCASRRNTSKMENELFEYVQSFDPKAVNSERQLLEGKEIDILSSKFGVGVEYCGLYWHSEKFRDSKYHYEKWKKCKENKVHLFTIFEGEDITIIKRMLKFRFGMGEKGTPARKTQIQKITIKDANIFLEKYHIQGGVRNVKVAYGAFDGDEMIAVMSLGHTSRQSKHKWELRRFVTDGRNHPGIASKIWKHFLNEYKPKSVVTMSDRRYFEGGLYEKLGFDYDGEVRPDYFYVKGLKRFHKSAFRKSSIRKKFPEYYNNDLTEREMMSNIGYLRIWDCGKDRWVWRQ